MRYREIITEAAIPAISPQQAHDQKMFGPLYHGTRADLGQIIATGFDTAKSMPTGIGGWRNTPLGTSNGYNLEAYGFTGIAAPVHHLGFGVYMTTQKAVAKKFAGDSVRGMRTFYLASPKVETINFGAANTMMRWWRSHGYDMTPEATRKMDTHAWMAATMKLTMNLQKDHDAVWFKGSAGGRRLLDGDQVCIYNTDLIRVIDPKLAKGLEIGAKVVHTQVLPDRFRGSNVFYLDDFKDTDYGSAGRLAAQGWRGIYRADNETRFPVHFIPPPGMKGVIVAGPFGPQNGRYSVKWSKGGEHYNYEAEELKPAE